MMADSGRFERYVALRYLRARRQTGMITIISIISVLGITVGVAALIVVMSVFNGFNEFAVEQLVSYDPHIRVHSADGQPVDPDEVIAAIDVPGVIAASPYIEGRSAIIVEQTSSVATIRGIDPDGEGGRIGELLKRTIGEDPSTESRGIVLGSSLAAGLNVSTGDTVSIVGRKGLELALSQVAQPTTTELPVSSTFALNQEYDAHVAFVPVNVAREIFDISDGAMGVELRLEDYRTSVEVAGLLEDQLGPDYTVETWQDLHSDLYGAMELERWSAFVIVMLIIIVAVFNVLGSLTMTVIEKRRDIGILKTLGATRASILRLFIFEGVLIGVIGTGIGLATGLGLCWLQGEYGLVSLDTTRYLLNALPVLVRPLDVLLITVAAMVLATVSAIYPAARAAGLQPADGIRWE